MNRDATPVMFLSGAGGGTVDPSIFRERPDDKNPIETIPYPGWRRYVEPAFSGEALIAQLADRVVSLAAGGPIRILGNSIGGHFGYAVAIHLEKSGREVAGFCAIDSGLTSPKPSSGWKSRALAEAKNLIRERRIGEFVQFVRSRFWRACLRLAPNMLTKVAALGPKPVATAIDPLFEKELDMRILLRETASYLETLDLNPTPLRAPAILLRTRLSADYDSVWQRRCPNLRIFEIPGEHHSIYEPENVGAFHQIYLSATQAWR